MGRPACSSCCKVVPIAEKGCKDDDFSVYYTIGNGGWIPSDWYAQHLLSGHNAGADRKDGFSDISEIAYACWKEDYGEYQTSLNCWNYPAAFLGKGTDWMAEMPPNLATEEDLNAKFQSGDEDYGMHMPKKWVIQLGPEFFQEPNSFIYIIRELVPDLDTYDEYYAGRKLGFPDRNEDVLGEDCGAPSSADRDPVLKIPDAAKWSNYLKRIDDMNNWPEGHWPDEHPYSGGGITSVQVKVTSHLVKWCTTIIYKQKAWKAAEIFKLVLRESNSITYKREYTLLNQGKAITGMTSQSRNLLEFDGERYTVIDQTLNADGFGSSALRPDALEAYTNFDYCLTYPFFSFNNFTWNFPTGGAFASIVDHTFANPPQGGPPAIWNPESPLPEGTIAMDRGGGQQLRAQKGVFTSISVMTERDSVVFNPYTGTLGRPITDDEFNNYDSLFPIQGAPTIEGIQELLPPPNPHWAQEDIDARNAENLTRIKANLKLQESGDLVVRNPADNKKIREGKVETPYFEYTDNKIRREGDLTQHIITEDDYLPPAIALPAGPDVPEHLITLPVLINPYEIDKLPNETVSRFKYFMDKDNDELGGIIFVSFRTKRGADKSGLSIEQGMKVYFPIGSCNEYTIVGVTNGPALSPVSVTLGGVGVVPISEIELVHDLFQYGMSARAYHLQLQYLTSLDDPYFFDRTYSLNRKDKEYYNPLKYRVTRIDLTNPSIDLSHGGRNPSPFAPLAGTAQGRVVWDEIAGWGPEGHPVMRFGQPDIAPTYTLVKPFPPYESPNVHSDNKAYIEITKELPWGGGKDEPTLMSHTLIKESCGDDAGEIMFDINGKYAIPKSLKDNVVVAGPADFEYRPAPSPVPIDQQRFSHIETSHPEEDSWMIHLDENTDGRDVGLKKTVDFKYKQLPKSSDDPNSPYANGYFFGGWLSLTFHLEEVSEWLKRQE